MFCDLHTHTNHSDGSYTPTELALAAKEKNLIIALTDHNTVTGLPEFLKVADREGVTAIGGTELSTEYEGKEFHLLGLFIKPEYYEKVESLCTEFIKLKEKSNIDLCNKLGERGYHVDFSAVKARNVKGNANRAHIAAELIKNGYFISVREAFECVLDEKCGLYTPPPRLQLTDAIAFLKEIGAVPVLAHPLKEVSPERLREILPVLIGAGLAGIETMHSSYSDETIATSKQIAEEFSLLESGGSDFHGLVKPDVSLGTGRGNLEIPECIYTALLDRHILLCGGKNE